MMITKSIVSIIFLIVAAILVIASIVNYIRNKGEKTIARRIWIQLAFVFAAIALVLFYINHFL